MKAKLMLVHVLAPEA